VPSNSWYNRWCSTRTRDGAPDGGRLFLHVSVIACCLIWWTYTDLDATSGPGFYLLLLQDICDFDWKNIVHTCGGGQKDATKQIKMIKHSRTVQTPLMAEFIPWYDMSKSSRDYYILVIIINETKVHIRVCNQYPGTMKQACSGGSAVWYPITIILCTSVWENTTGDTNLYTCFLMPRRAKMSFSSSCSAGSRFESGAVLMSQHTVQYWQLVHVNGLAETLHNEIFCPSWIIEKQFVLRIVIWTRTFM
jgi:hypothetical protein